MGGEGERAPQQRVSVSSMKKDPPKPEISFIRPVGGLLELSTSGSKWAVTELLMMLDLVSVAR